MAGETFKVGDTVKPKSGGPRMTITGVKMGDKGQEVWTVWFDKDHNEKTGFYPAAALQADDGSVHIA